MKIQMNSNQSNSNDENKDSMCAILNSDSSDSDKLKSIDERKIAANNKFEKIGHLPIQAAKSSQDAKETVEKMPVLDLLSGSYQNELNFTDYHRPCNCTKSYCLKLYCECFARDKLCVNCNCNNCMNNIGHEKSRSTALLRILDKNPLAFLPKIGSGQGHKLHRKGCNCKRSECLKNYCECREAKIECSLLCRCQGCKNRSSDLSTHSSQAPCSLDLTILDSNGFKSSNMYKSSHVIESDKASENATNDLSYQFPGISEETNISQQNIYCNEAPIPDYGSHISFQSVNEPGIDEMMRITDNYTKMNGAFYKVPSQQPSGHNEAQAVNSKVRTEESCHSINPCNFGQSRLINWSSFVNPNPEAVEYKHLPNQSTYNLLNYPKFSNTRRSHRSYPTPFPPDIDANSGRIMSTHPFQYFNEADEYLDMSSINYFKTINSIPNMKRFDPGNTYPFPMHLNSNPNSNVHSSGKCEPNDSSEVTSTNEMDPNAMLVSSGCDSVIHNSLMGDNIIKPPSCDSHSPLSLTTNENYNCFPFNSDSAFSNSTKINFAMKYPNGSHQSINGHVLPSLFHNDCDSMEMNAPNMQYFRQGNVAHNQISSSSCNSPSMLQRKPNRIHIDDQIQSLYPASSNFINSNNQNFYNFYNEHESSFVNSSVHLDHDDLINKSESVAGGLGLVTNSYPILSDNFNPFFYGQQNESHSKIVPCNTNPHH